MSNNEWNNEINEFKKWLSKEKNLTGTTPNNYATHIQRLDKPIDLNDFTGENGDEKINELINKLELAITSIPVRSAFKHYIKFKKQQQNLSINGRKNVSFLLDEISVIDLNSSDNLSEGNIEKRTVNADEMEKIINYIDENLDPSDFDGNEKWYDEFKLIPIMIRQSGCRIGELIGKQGKQEKTGLFVTDVNIENNTFEVFKGKGNKSRKASLDTDILIDFMEKYDLVDEKQKKVFTIPYTKVWYRLKVIGKKTIGRGIRDDEKPLKTHDFRHTFATSWATELLEDDKSYYEALEKVQNYFEHEDQETTKIYVHIARENIKEGNGNIYDSGEKDKTEDFGVKL